MQVARRVASPIVVPSIALAVPATSTPALQASDGSWLLEAEGVVDGFGAAAGFTEGGVPTPTGEGYDMVGADGGVFAFGDASDHGSMGGQPLNAPIVALIPTAGGGGYVLVARDGGIFAFGTAAFYGSMGGVPLNQPIVGAVGSGGRDLLVAADGGIFAFGPTAFHGSLGADPPPTPVVAVASLPVPEDLIRLGWEQLLETGEVTVRQHAVLIWSLDRATPLSAPGFTSTDLGAG